VSCFYVPAESLLQSRAFRRLLAVSLAGHILVFAALVLRPSGHARLIAPAPVMVNLVALPKPAPAPKPPPAKPAAKPAEKPPEPVPPPPPKPLVKEIVIPKEPKPLEKPKPAPAPPAPAKPQPPPPSADELLAKMTEKVEAQEAAKPPPEAPQAAPANAARGTAGDFDPLFSPWVANVQVRVRSNWSGASVCSGAPKFDVDVDSAGQLSNIQLAESSGDKYCDETGERALRKSNPLPPPPHAISLTLNLNPKDKE